MNMKNKFQANKKIILVMIAVLLALIVGIIILVMPDYNKISDKNSGTKIEQNEEDTNPENDKKDMQEQTGLEVLEPDKVVQGESSDASGYWDDTSYGDIEQETETESETKEILKDNITWGDIY